MQGNQFHTGNSHGQSLQAMGMMGSLNMSSQLRANGALAYAQRVNQNQLRQQLSQQNPLTTTQVLILKYASNIWFMLKLTVSFILMNFQLTLWQYGGDFQEIWL